MKAGQQENRYYRSASTWQATQDSANQERARLTVEMIPQGVASVLDVGCGDGLIGNILLEAGLQVTGVDISEAAMERFRGTRVAADITALPFPDGSFDLVLSSEVLEHLDDEQLARATREMSRIARRFLLVSTPCREHLPTAEVLCPRCGFLFHRNYHKRSFDESGHGLLFPAFTTADIKMAGSWRMVHPAILAVKNGLLGIYTSSLDLYCPRCGAIVPRYRESPLKGFILRQLLRANRVLMRESPRWVMTLLERRPR